MKNRMKKVLAIAIVYMMALTLCAGALAAEPADFTDLPDKSHYTYSGVIAAIQNGIMHGDGLGHFMPNKIMKRVEAATYLVRIMKAQTKADISNISDYVHGSWYDKEGSLAIAINLGLVDVVNGRVNPDDEITREEAFEMLARVINATGGTDKDLERFVDSKDISGKYKSSLASLVKGGYILGSLQGSSAVMNPKGTISRAEFATLFGRVFEQYVSKPGVYTNVYNGNMVINSSGITLKDATVTGDLIVGDGAGDVNLDNITVGGRVIVRGGSVSIGGRVEHVSVVNRNAKVTLAADADIGTLDISGDQITVNTSRGSLIDTLLINGKSVKVAGYVIIYKAHVNASGAVIETNPVETFVDKSLSANIGGNAVSGTFKSDVSAPSVTLKLGQGAYKNLESLYAAAKSLAQRNSIVIEIASTPDDILVLDAANFPGNNNVTVKYGAGYLALLTYGVVIERSNVTLDGLTFNISDLSRLTHGDFSYNIISVDGYKKGLDGNDLLIENTTLRHCNVIFCNEFAGYNVTAVYFDSDTTSGNTIAGGNIDVIGQQLPFETIGIHSGAVTLDGVTVKSSDRALVVERDAPYSDISITGDTQFYSASGVAVELRLDKSEIVNNENAFGTAFGGYTNLKFSTVKRSIDNILNSAIKTDAENGYVISGVKLRDYRTPSSEYYYKDESGYIWSRCYIANTWVYCNNAVNGSFTAGRMYMLTDSESHNLTTVNTRYVKANCMLGTDFADMTALSTSTAGITNHPALNNSIKYKVISLQPYTGEVKGFVASLTSIPYAVDTHLAANGSEVGANDPSRAGNLNSARLGRVNLTVCGTPDTALLLYLNLNTTMLGKKGNSGIVAWHFVDGVESAMSAAYLTGTDQWSDYSTGYATVVTPASRGQLLDYSLTGYDNPANPLTVNRQEVVVSSINSTNTFIIKGDDGAYQYVVFTVATN